MYKRGDIVIITEKSNLSNYMVGLVVKVYSDSIYVASLSGTFDESRLKNYKKLGIKYGKYIRFANYNIYVSNSSKEYYSEDDTFRTIDRKLKHINYNIRTKYYEYVGTYSTLNGKRKTFSYVYIEKLTKNRKEFSGGFATTSCNMNINEDSLINKARYRAEVNMYQQFA